MTAEEFLIDKWNSCVWLINDDTPDSIVMVYDPIYIRQKKLNSLFNSNDEIIFHKTEDSKVLFIQNYKYFDFDFDYDEIYSVLYHKYNIDFVDIQLLIKNTLLKNTTLTPKIKFEQRVQLKNKLSPHIIMANSQNILEKYI